MNLTYYVNSGQDSFGYLFICVVGCFVAAFVMNVVGDGDDAPFIAWSKFWEIFLIGIVVILVPMAGLLTWAGYADADNPVRGNNLTNSIQSNLKVSKAIEQNNSFASVAYPVQLNLVTSTDNRSSVCHYRPTKVVMEIAKHHFLGVAKTYRIDGNLTCDSPDVTLEHK